MANFQFPAFFLKTLVVESNWCLQFLVVSCVPHQLELDWWLCWLVSPFWFMSLCLLCLQLGGATAWQSSPFASFVSSYMNLWILLGAMVKAQCNFHFVGLTQELLVDVTIEVLKHKQSEIFWHNVCLSRAWRVLSNISNQWYAHCQGVGCFNMECWQFGSDVVVTGTR